jgi:hypothetical protein
MQDMNSSRLDAKKKQKEQKAAMADEFALAQAAKVGATCCVSTPRQTDQRYMHGPIKGETRNSVP